MSVDRPLGEIVANWTPPIRPNFAVLKGRYVQLELLSAEHHAAQLFGAYVGHDWVWDYLGYGPFSSASQYHRWMKEATQGDDPIFYALRDLETGQLGGVCSYLRIDPGAGSIELGHIVLAPVMQGTRAATEAFYLLMEWAFAAGYRRFEWKCHAMNIPSRRAAQRLGLSYEGVFRQALVTKGRNRDTAWFAAIDKDWPGLQAAYGAWLAPQNFDETGQQRERLGDLTALVRVSRDPVLE